MSRKVIVYILSVFMIGIAAVGIFLIGDRGAPATERSAESPAEQTAAHDTRRDSTGRSRSHGARKPSTASRETDRSEPAVSAELARELKLTRAEQEKVNTLIAEIETERRARFDEVSRGDKTVEEVTIEIGELRQQLAEKIRDLLGDERATALFRALR